MNSPLQAGRRRGRRAVRFLLYAVGVLAVAGAAAAAVYLVVLRDDEGTGESRAASPAGRVRATGAGARVLRSQPIPRVRARGVDAFHFQFRKPPRAALLFDVGTGEVLWRHKPLTRLPMASLTKIMTAVLVTERASPDERVMITPAVLRYSGSGVGVLPKKRRVRLEVLLNGLMIVSGNDAGIALAGHVAGNERRFVGLMNRRAREYGLKCTRFASSHGLEPGNRSCARDLAVMTRMAMRSRRVARVANRRNVTLPFPVKGGKLVLTTHNPLFRMKYPGAIGLKTGFIDEAGRCFVGVARRGRRTLGVVILNSPNPGKHAAGLLDLGFKQG